MQPAGEAAFAKRREDRTAIYSFEGSWAFDDVAEAALRADADGWAFWEAQPKGYRRLATHWVMSAKRPETRERRLAQLVEACAASRRLPQLTGTARDRPPSALIRRSAAGDEALAVGAGAERPRPGHAAADRHGRRSG